MLRAMRAAASGMSAQQLYLDTIANNLANVNTNGYKRSRIDFEDLLYQTMTPTTAAGNGNAGTPVPLQVGHGTRPVDSEKIYSQGDSENTGNPLDMAIQGDGFFQVLRSDGSTAYTRDGSFKTDASGQLVTAEGYMLQPAISLPSDATSVSISKDGHVLVQQSGNTTTSDLGQIQLARFVNPAGLIADGGNILLASPSTGDAQVGAPGSTGMGTLLQGTVEHSNVNVVEEMVNMIVAQRAFEMNSKAIKTADDMMSLADNIRPS